MKTNWQTKNFEDCLDKVVYTNKIQRKDFLESGVFPVVSQEAEDINGYWDDEKDLFKIEKPVVVFGDHTKVLKYVDFDFVLGADGVKILCPKSFLDPMFFYYFLQSVELKSLGYARHYRLLKEIKISFPPIPEQHHIIKILDEVFENVAKAKENAEKNLQNSKELFGAYLNKIFTNPYSDFEIKTIRDIADIKGGKRIPKGKKLQIELTDYPYIRVSDFNDEGSIDLNDIRYTTKEIFEQIKRYTISTKDLYISIAGTIGKTGIIPNELDGASLTENACKLVFRKNIDNKYIYYFTKNNNFVEQAGLNTRTTAMPKLALTRLGGITLPIPKSLPEQKSIVTKLDALSAETKKLEAIYKQKLADLEELKKSVLKSAFAEEL